MASCVTSRRVELGPAFAEVTASGIVEGFDEAAGAEGLDVGIGDDEVACVEAAMAANDGILDVIVDSQIGVVPEADLKRR